MQVCHSCLRNLSRTPSGLNKPSLDQLVQFYLDNVLARSTQRTYQSGQKQYYTAFCTSLSINPFPVSENSLRQFIAQLSFEGISHRSIKEYLSAIRHQQISLVYPNPHICKMPKLEQVIKGIKGKQGSTPRTRLPITLLKLREFWELDARSFDHIMLWDAVCLCFLVSCDVAKLLYHLQQLMTP